MATATKRVAAVEKFVKTKFEKGVIKFDFNKFANEALSVREIWASQMRGLLSLSERFYARVS